MPIYTFYPCQADGSSAMFEAFELDDDGEAQVRAAQLLEEHSSCAFVMVWQGDREVLTLPRAAQASRR